MTARDVPLYRKIYDDLLQQIADQTLKPGDKLPTESELMALYRVSRITASRAMNELAQNGYIVRTRKSGSFVRDPKEPFTESASFSHPMAVIAFVTSVETTALGNLINGMQLAARNYGYVLSVHISNRDIHTERRILEDLLYSNVSGVICWAIESYANIELFTQLKMRDIPVVLLDHPIVGVEVPVVTSDNVTASYELTKRLIAKGHKHLAYCGFSYISSFNEQRRIKGYINALKEHQIPLNSDYILHLNPDTDSNLMTEEDALQVEYARSMLLRLRTLPQPPTALICAHDMLAAHLEKEALELGIAVPDELSITGFDDLFFCDHLAVPLSSVAQDFFSLGETAVEQLVLLITGKEPEPLTLLPCRIIERQSVCNLNAKRNAPKKDDTV